MKVILFNDKDNFEKCLNAFNDFRKAEDKRFFKIDDYIKYIFKKIGVLEPLKDKHLYLTRSYVYTGKYNSKLISNHKRACGREIEDLTSMIKQEQLLLDKINKTENLDDNLREDIQKHVSEIIEVFNNQKKKYIDIIEKTKRRAEGQRKLFSSFVNKPFVELRVSDLRLRKGIIIQKGIDVKLACDLINLGYTNAYDIAIILGGDIDILESIKLVKSHLGRIIILVSYYDEFNAFNSCISPDLIKEADYFLNLKDFEEKDILDMSSLRKKTDKK